jgi:hypothetical protein
MVEKGAGGGGKAQTDRPLTWRAIRAAVATAVLRGAESGSDSDRVPGRESSRESNAADSTNAKCNVTLATASPSSVVTAIEKSTALSLACVT